MAMRNDMNCRKFRASFKVICDLSQTCRPLVDEKDLDISSFDEIRNNVLVAFNRFVDKHNLTRRLLVSGLLVVGDFFGRA